MVRVGRFIIRLDSTNYPLIFEGPHAVPPCYAHPACGHWTRSPRIRQWSIKIKRRLVMTARSSLLVEPSSTHESPSSQSRNERTPHTSTCTEGRGLELPGETAQSAPPFSFSRTDIQCVRHSGYIERFVIISPSDNPLFHKASGDPSDLSIPRIHRKQ